MKWIVLAALIGLIPLLTQWLRRNDRRAPLVWSLLGLIPLVIDRPLFGTYDLYMAAVSWPMWPGFAKGIEISLVDAIALAVVLSRFPFKRATPHKGIFIAYFAVVVVTGALSGAPTAASFYAWQLLRSFLLFTAVVAICDDDRAPAAIVSGAVLGFCIQAGLGAYDYITGATAVLMAFGHQNLFGLMSHFVVFPAFALLLAGRNSWAAIAGPVVGVGTVALTASRASIGFAGAGYVLLLALSMLRRTTARKSGIAFLGFALLAATAPLAISSLSQRFQAVPLSEDYDERAAFEKAANMILTDYPGGVGANQYVVIANTGGYSDRAGVVAVSGSRSAHVHHFYLLVAAETGWLGLILVVIMIVGAIKIALHTAFKFRRDPRGDILVGLGVSLLVVALHSFYEWILITFYGHYMFAVTAGLIVGIAREIRYAAQGDTAARTVPPRAMPLVARL